MSTALLLHQTRSAPRPSSEHHHNSYEDNVNLISVKATSPQADGQCLENITDLKKKKKDWVCERNLILTQLFSVFAHVNIMYLYSCTVVSELFSIYRTYSRLTKSFFVCLSQKAPTDPRYLWTQLSSVDSTSVDTDYEQYDPSNESSVPLSTFRSELPSFIFLSICI